MAPAKTIFDGKKHCKTCKEWKPVDEFHLMVKARYRVPVYRAHCIPCHTYNVRDEYYRLRLGVLNHYSGGHPHCACCGEEELGFLAIDHINNDGAQHRKEIGSKNIVHWLTRHGFPEGFQILCHNCNWAKTLYGVCPHQGKVTYYGTSN